MLERPRDMFLRLWRCLWYFSCSYFTYDEILFRAMLRAALHTDFPMVPTTVGRRQLGGLTCGL